MYFSASIEPPLICIFIHVEPCIYKEHSKCTSPQLTLKIVPGEVNSSGCMSDSFPDSIGRADNV